ncbi:helix-turn-helix domain-containing protein [Amycolatopsis taiwanensis]|uniref:helix-turn-helix domain-containing protein n=1 Tax=Amycolatopsis taiwanensis TaxID=342230 RepID=UPI003CCBAD77
MGRGRPLQQMEREMIALGIKKSMSSREIGEWIGRDHSVVSREINPDLAWGGRLVLGGPWGCCSGCLFGLGQVGGARCRWGGRRCSLPGWCCWLSGRVGDG